MDPDKTLEMIRKSFEIETDDDIVSLVKEHFEALDEWLCKGGFLPNDWKQ